ncbi:MAG: hypothetical protein ACQCN6_06710 [Candidatus Bathyarchaeia archaeon]
MPFCRKCGRRLAEYSKVCTDCGQSTTSPIVNIKRTQGTRFLPEGADDRITSIIIPQVAADKPTKAIAVIRAVAPIKPTVKAFEPPKPGLSAKHITKSKKAKPSKPAAPFTIANARPVAGFEVPQPKLVASPKPPPPKAVAPAAPVASPKPAAQPQPSVAPVIPLPVAQPKPAAPSKTRVAIAKLAPPPPAPVYPPHEIIKSNVSLKKDILTNPQDYETESFEFDLECRHGHFWLEGSVLPVSNGRAYCPQCGERLRKPKPKPHRRRRHRRL